MITPVKELVDNAVSEIENISADAAKVLLEDPEFQLIDIRDIRELWREGTIPGAFHAPRGMLEFWVDPASPYHNEIFSSGKKIVFYCAAGWRSALATKAMQDMGLKPVAHITGGFSAWREAGGAIEEVAKPGVK